jgi:hypothetical protein
MTPCIMVEFSDISKERRASIFRVEEETKQASRSRLISCLTCFSTVKMVVVRSFKISLNVKTTRRHIPDDGAFNKLLSVKISFHLILTDSLIEIEK